MLFYWFGLLALIYYAHSVIAVEFSVLGDPEMKSKRVRVALESWNFCNEVGEEAPGMGSPRYADCSDYECPESNSCRVKRRVKERDNRLHAG